MCPFWKKGNSLEGIHWGKCDLKFNIFLAKTGLILGKAWNLGANSSTSGKVRSPLSAGSRGRIPYGPWRETQGGFAGPVPPHSLYPNQQGIIFLGQHSQIPAFSGISTVSIGQVLGLLESSHKLFQNLTLYSCVPFLRSV